MEAEAWRVWYPARSGFPWQTVVFVEVRVFVTCQSDASVRNSVEEVSCKSNISLSIQRVKNEEIVMYL